MRKVLVTFALKDEFAPWRRRHQFHPLPGAPHRVEVGRVGGSEVSVTLVGAGAVDAHFVKEFSVQVAPSLGIVTGVAAGLQPAWRAGHLLVAQTVIGTGGNPALTAPEPWFNLAVQCGAKPAPALVTISHIARTVEEKSRLADLAAAADMESLPLIEHWSALGIPALALRVILDPVEAPMTCDFEAAMDAYGQVRVGRIVAQLARRPQGLPHFLHLARQSRRVLRILASYLDRFFARLEHDPSIL